MNLSYEQATQIAEFVKINDHFIELLIKCARCGNLLLGTIAEMRNVPLYNTLLSNDQKQKIFLIEQASQTAISLISAVLSPDPYQAPDEDGGCP